MANNITKVYLLRTPLENDYKHTLYFTDKDSQSSYFLSKKVKEYTDFSYQRKDNIIRVPDHFDNIYNCNYVMYQNSNYSNKWFYAFIKDMKYINDGVTHIEIETDVIQTWLFDYTIKPSFVEREHVDYDEIGEHTIPEGLELGDYVCNGKTSVAELKDLCIVMAYSDYAGSDYNIKGKLYGGIYSGLAYSVYPITEAGIKSLNDTISSYDTAGKSDAINSIFMCPKRLVSADDDFGAMTLGGSETSKNFTKNVDKQDNLDSYFPRNKKLLTFPYIYKRVSNNAGGSAIFKEELFAGTTCDFSIKGVITPGCSIRLTPYNYERFTTGDKLIQDCGLNGGKYPICCWNSDTYTNWLTQNSVNLGIGFTSSVLSVMGGIGATVTGVGALAGIPMIAGGVMGIANSMGQVHQASLVPDQVKGNTNCGDVITSAMENTFFFYDMSIKNEYARIIDSFFDMFGYKVNEVKTPNKAHRSRWWYTKTIDVNIDGNIVQDDLNKIKSAYNNGITFWRNASEIGNYSLTNDIL